MLRTIYGFDDLGRKVKIGEYEVPDPVGGKIFRIINDNDEVVEFYDAQGNVIQNVNVGDSPASYKVISPSTSGEDKYYVYDTTYTPTYTGKFYWTYKKDGNWVYENVGTSDDIGSGKANTLKIMAIRDGEYITDNADPSSQTPTETLWWFINYMNTNKIGGCDDWYIGSYQDNLSLRNSMDAQTIADYGFGDGMLTSAEYTDSYAYAVKDVTGTFMLNKKEGTHKGCAIRSF